MYQQITIISLILKTIMDYAATWFDVNLSISDTNYISFLTQLKDNWSRSYTSSNVYGRYNRYNLTELKLLMKIKYNF